MTFDPDRYLIWEKRFPMFFDWIYHHERKGRELLFLPVGTNDPDDFKRWDATSKIYLLMKRLRQPYETLINMSIEERDRFFTMEMELMKREKEAEKANKQK